MKNFKSDLNLIANIAIIIAMNVIKVNRHDFTKILVALKTMLMIQSIKLPRMAPCQTLKSILKAKPIQFGSKNQNQNKIRHKLID